MGIKKDDLIEAKNKAGEQLKPAGDKFFPARLLPWLRKRKPGVKKGSVKLKPQPLRLRALEAAKKDLGIREKGGNNVGPEVEKIIAENDGQRGEPWCGDAIARWYRKGGSKVVQRGWAAVRLLGTLTGMSKADKRRGLPGDIIVLYKVKHTGLLVHYATPSGGVAKDRRTASHARIISGNTRVGLKASDGGGGEGVDYDTVAIDQIDYVVKVRR